MDADSAPHPFATLMPDSVEQSSDANECVCLQEGLQTTVVEGPDSAEEHSLLGTAASSGLPPKLQNREKKKAYVIHVGKNHKLKIWSLLNLFKLYQISTFATRSRRAEEWVETNSQPAPEHTIVSAIVKCYHLDFKKPTRGPLSPLNQRLYSHTASHCAAV